MISVCELLQMAKDAIADVAVFATSCSRLQRGKDNYFKIQMTHRNRCLVDAD